MPTPDRIDLNPYGIRMILRKGMSFEYETLGPGRLAQGSFSRSQGRVDLHTGTYSIGPELGSGSYGKTFQVIHTLTSHAYVVKVITVRHISDVNEAIKEAIMNLILEKESEKQPNGPYVPRFFELAYDPQRNLILMRIERLQGTLEDIYQASTPQQNDVLVPETLGDLAHILHFFYDHLKFNHRDMKTNNVGYNLLPDGRHTVKLIDFGYACLTWKGVRITGASYFDITDQCYIPSRDMTQLFYEMLVFQKHLFSPSIVGLLKDLLTFPLNKTICRLFEGCRLGKKAVGAKDWGHNIYRFLNNRRVRNPHAEPKAVYERMLGFLGETVPKEMNFTVTQETPTIRHCLPEQVFNPKTRRCVRRSGKVGRRILKATRLRTPSPTYLRETKRQHQTRRQAKKATVDLKPCGLNQSRNPKTRRCRKACNAHQIRNPATGRCVTRKGALGLRAKAMGAITSPRVR